MLLPLRAPRYNPRSVNSAWPGAKRYRRRQPSGSAGAVLALACRARRSSGARGRRRVHAARGARRVVRHNHPVRVVEVPNIDRYAAEWDELVAAMHLPSPFLRSWWLGAVDDGAGAYVLVLDGDRLVGGLPLAKRALARTDRVSLRRPRHGCAPTISTSLRRRSRLAAVSRGACGVGATSWQPALRPGRSRGAVAHRLLVAARRHEPARGGAVRRPCPPTARTTSPADRKSFRKTVAAHAQPVRRTRGVTSDTRNQRDVTPRSTTSSACTASAATGPNCSPNYRRLRAALDRRRRRRRGMGGRTRDRGADDRRSSIAFAVVRAGEPLPDRARAGRDRGQRRHRSSTWLRSSARSTRAAPRSTCCAAGSRTSRTCGERRRGMMSGCSGRARRCSHWAC